jgi:hypothetical protein
LAVHCAAWIATKYCGYCGAVRHVYSEWAPECEDLAMELQRRVVADFRDGAKFEENLGKLLRALERRKQSDDPAAGDSA